MHVALADAPGNEVKGALDPQQMTDVLTAYSAEQGMPLCWHLGVCIIVNLLVCSLATMSDFSAPSMCPEAFKRPLIQNILLQRD